jgi:hypothetical protein
MPWKSAGQLLYAIFSGLSLKIGAITGAARSASRRFLFFTGKKQVS